MKHISAGIFNFLKSSAENMKDPLRIERKRGVFPA
jgi:hypothetical protein